MRLIGLAMLYSARNIPPGFPRAVIEKDGKPLLSWRVAILPYVSGEDASLYKQFHLNEPWDSPHNFELAKKIPTVFRSLDSPNDGKTRVMLFTGKGAPFDGAKKISTFDIGDLSRTILCVEAGPDKAVPWTKPKDLTFDPENPLGIPGVALRSTPGYSRCAADAADVNHQVSDRVAVTFD